MWKCPHKLYNQWMVKVNRGSMDASMTCILAGMVCNANIDMMLLKCLMWVLPLLLLNTRFRMGKQLLMGEHHHCTPQIHMEPKNWPHTNRSSRTQFLGFDVNIFGILVRASSRISMCWLDRQKTTHLLRNILSNYWCGMHRTCKKHLSKSDRNCWMIGSEILCEGHHSTSLLEGLTSSDAVQSDCENRTVGWFENCWKTAGKTTSQYLA